MQTGAIRRDIWEKIPFDPSVTNIEDRIWAGEVIKAGYKLIYEPEAAVFHYHGIHQTQSPNARCEHRKSAASNGRGSG